MSRDGRRVAVARTVQGNTDVWLLDGVRASRLTFDAAVDSYPVWSPDGSRIAFSSNRTGQYALYQMLTIGGGEEPLIAASGQLKTGESRIPYSWTADGRSLLCSVVASQGNADLWIRTDGGGTHTVGVHEDSPSVRSMVCSRRTAAGWPTNRTRRGGRKSYVRPIAPPGAVGTAAAAGGQWQVSTVGGVFPAWRPDGKRKLYYLNPAGVMMAASITVTGTTLAPGAPVVLFPTRVAGGGVDTQQGRRTTSAPTDGS